MKKWIETTSSNYSKSVIEAYMEVNPKSGFDFFMTKTFCSTLIPAVVKDYKHVLRDVNKDENISTII